MMILTPNRLAGNAPSAARVNPMFALEGLSYNHALYFAALNLFLGLFFPDVAMAKAYFDPISLERKGRGVTESDLEQFSSSESQLPGVYYVGIYLNGRAVDTRGVTFIEQDGKLHPEFTVAELKAMGVKTEAISALSSLPAESTLTDLSQLITDASSTFDFGQQRLDISIPQAALNIAARNSVDPALWDHGLTSAHLNYNYSGASSTHPRSGSNDRTQFLSLRSGFNVGAWRGRNYSTYSGDVQGNGRWQSINTYAQRDVHALKSQLTLGDSTTSGVVFDSVAFRGAQLASDDNMLPDSLRGFAPVIRGIAQSTAQVLVRQNGYVIYQTYVAPGAFAITDLYPTAASGDLEVVIREADGTERVSVQPFSAAPIMLREGQLKYSAIAGRYRSAYRNGNTPAFAQGTLIYGLPRTNTVYGGIQTSQQYQSIAVGLGHGFGELGALSADITHAQTALREGSQHRGQSYRLQYSKSVAATATTFTLAGYRYSTSGFYDLAQASDIERLKRESAERHKPKRSRLQLNITQSLGDVGNFYIAASQQDYWQRRGKERNVTAGYNVSYRGISYGLDYVHTRMPRAGSDDRQWSFTVAVPLDAFMAGSWARYRVMQSQSRGAIHSTGLNGTALADNNLSYQLQQAYDRRGQGYGGNVAGSYKGSYGEVNLGYGYDRNLRQINYGAQGSVVAHAYGVTFSQPTGDTAVLVRAQGASGVKIANNVGVKTDWRGYTVVPYAATYRYNRIALETDSYADDLDVDSATASVVPTQGALVLADFKTRIGSKVLITLKHRTGVVPFGAMASVTSQKHNSGIVGDNGQVYLSGIAEKGALEVTWGREISQQCRAVFSLSEESAPSLGVKKLTVVCQ